MAGRHMNLQSIIAIDPGSEHCGVAVFVAVMDEDGVARLECRLATERTPESMFDSLKVWSSLYGNDRLDFDVMVVERFVLYPDKAMSLAWSDLRTVEVIGALRERCRGDGVPFVLQSASVKKATEGMLRARGITLKSRGAGEHAKDAEVHGWYYWLRTAEGGQQH